MPRTAQEQDYPSAEASAGSGTGVVDGPVRHVFSRLKWGNHDLFARRTFGNLATLLSGPMQARFLSLPFMAVGTKGERPVHRRPDALEIDGDARRPCFS